MSRFSRLALSSVLHVALVAASAPAAAPDAADPFDALKAVAKAKYEAARRTPAERARALAETAHAGLQATFQDFNAGKTTADGVLLWRRQVLDAELVLLDKDGDPAPIYEQAWRIAREGWKIAEVKRQTGKIGVADTAGPRLARLQDELDWLAHRGGEGKTAFSEPDPLAEQDWWPRDKADAVGADPRELARERLETAREELHACRQEFESGKILPCMVLEPVLQVLGAELAMLDKGADPTSFLENRWRTLREIEGTAKIKWADGKLGSSDLATCRCVRLEAEIAWIRVWKERAERGPRLRPDFLAGKDDAADDARWAKAKEEASRADVRALLRERLQAAREACQGRLREFDTGRITAGLALDASLGLMEAERAVAAGPKEEATALEKYWERALEMEAIAARKLQAGKIAFADMQEVRYARIQAEMWMTAGRAGREAVRPLADRPVPG